MEHNVRTVKQISQNAGCGLRLHMATYSYMLALLLRKAQLLSQPAEPKAKAAVSVCR